MLNCLIVDEEFSPSVFKRPCSDKQKILHYIPVITVAQNTLNEHPYDLQPREESWYHTVLLYAHCRLNSFSEHLSIASLVLIWFYWYHGSALMLSCPFQKKWEKTVSHLSTCTHLYTCIFIDTYRNCTDIFLQMRKLLSPNKYEFKWE